MCNHPKCPKEYCQVQYYHDKYKEISNTLSLVDSKFEYWKDTCYMPETTNLQFNGVQLTLYPDGRYELGDTTG